MLFAFVRVSSVPVSICVTSRVCLCMGHTCLLVRDQPHLRMHLQDTELQQPRLYQVTRYAGHLITTRLLRFPCSKQQKEVRIHREQAVTITGSNAFRSGQGRQETASFSYSAL